MTIQGASSSPTSRARRTDRHPVRRIEDQANLVLLPGLQSGNQSQNEVHSPFLGSLGSGNGVDLVMPSVDHRVAIEVVNKLDDALLQLVL